MGRLRIQRKESGLENTAERKWSCVIKTTCVRISSYLAFRGLTCLLRLVLSLHLPSSLSLSFSCSVCLKLVFEFDMSSSL